MQKSRNNKEVIQKLAIQMEQMYYSFEREKSNRHVEYVGASMEKYVAPIEKITSVVDCMGRGKRKEELLQTLKDEQSSFLALKSNINTRFKLYVRGLGNSGKSTLVNALLAVSENIGSEMDKKPLTFCMESFSGDISMIDAEVIRKGKSGLNETVPMKRAEAKKMAADERNAFEQSKKECQEMIREACKGIVNLRERQEKQAAIYRSHLMQPAIREIKWGIGANKFLDNCILIDTPGLRQELRFTSLLEDVHHYEADGILWVISSEKLNSSTVIDEYKKELEYFKDVRDNNRMIAVINMHDEEIIYDSRSWNRLMEQAKKNFTGQFDYIIGVNNLLAYEGNVEKNQKKITDSNIEELRKLINMLFSERSSDECTKNHIDKVNRFLAGYQKVIDTTMQAFRQYVEKYNEKTEYIKHGSNGIQSMCENHMKSVVRQYIQDMETRVYKNASKINALDEMSSMERERFLNNEIIRSNELTNNLVKASEHLMKRMQKEFNMIYKNSVVSEYEFIAFEEFSKTNHNFHTLDKIHVERIRNVYQSVQSLKSDIAHSLNASFLGGIFSEATVSAVAGFFAKVKKAFENKQKKIIKVISEQANAAIDQYQSPLDDNVKKYEQSCMKVRDLSLEQEIGSYSKIQDTQKKLIEAKQQLEDMGFVGITLPELILK